MAYTACVICSNGRQWFDPSKQLRTSVSSQPILCIQNSFYVACEIRLKCVPPCAHVSFRRYCTTLQPFFFVLLCASGMYLNLFITYISFISYIRNHAIYIFVIRPASWSSGQSLWLLIMRSRVRFPALPWEFSLKGKIPAVTMVCVG